MAVDTQKLFYLLDPVFQIENLAGKPVVGGHIEVFVAGTDTKYITWQDWGGARNPFKIPLKSDGRAVILVEPQYTYDVYIYDSFNNMVCSRLNVSPAIGGDVSVSGLTQVYHDETISGNGTPQEPIGVVSAGKVYEGIEPIVVNNTEDKISANHVPLGVQEPLYFVQDDEEACILGFSGQTIPEGVMSESGLGFDNDKITGYNGSAFSAGNEYEAGNYISISGNTISVTGLQPVGDYAYNSALSSKLDVTATGQFLTGLPEDLMYSGDMTAYQPVGDYQTAGDYLSASDSANFLLTSDSAIFYPMNSNPSGYLTAHQSLQGYATEQWVENKGYITGVDIPASAGWNEATTVVNNNSAIWNNTTNIVSGNSAQWGASNPQIPVTGINGIKISESGDKVVFEVSGDYATNAQLADKQDSLSYGYHDTAISSIDNSAVYDNSAHARINTLAGRISDLSSNKLDTSAFSDVSGLFLQSDDITGKQDISGMTAYQPTMSFGYDGTGAISSINESALAGTTYSAGSGIDITDEVISVDNTIARTADLPNIFIAVYNSTPFSALQEAFAAGKMILCKDSDTSPRVFTTNSVSLYQGELSTIRFAGSLNVSTDRIIDNNTIIRQYSCFTGGWSRDTVTAYSALQSDWNQTGVKNIGYIKNKPDLTQYQLTADMTAYQPAGAYLTTGDSANFYTTANPSGFISEVPAGTMNESAFGYDANDKISGYNGSAFAGGSDVPEGVMVESGLEYNAVNEISGYNGSAIAQYGAEKQWLVHDDTLVHASNSAQYALGVNLSAVAQLLGVDETVLWETNGSDFIASGSTVSFSGNPYDYNKLKFVASSDEMAPVEIITYPNSARINVSWNQITNNQFRIWDTIVNIDSAGMTAGPAVMAMANSTGTGNSISTNQINWTWNYRLIKQVIGIGRKQ